MRSSKLSATEKEEEEQDKVDKAELFTGAFDTYKRSFEFFDLITSLLLLNDVYWVG